MNKGFLLLEALLSGTIIALIVTLAFGSQMYISQIAKSNSNYVQALNLATSGLEASFNARENNYGQFVNGTYGIYENGSNYFLHPSPNIIDNFTRKIIVTGTDTNKKEIISVVDWQDLFSTKSVQVKSFLYNWQSSSTLPICTNQSSNFSFITTNIDDNGRAIEGLELKNNASNCYLIVQSVRVSWNGRNKRMQEAIFNNLTVWSSGGVGLPNGSQSSGTLLDIVDFTLQGNATLVNNTLRFNNSVNNATYTLIFYFSDATQSTVTFTI